LHAPRNNHSRPASESVTVSSAQGGRGWTPPPLIRRCRGLQQDAPRGKLYVDPARPAWLPQVTLTDLRLGRRRFDIHFWRDGKKTVFKVLNGGPNAVESRRIMPPAAP
jgi:hypothetical protein